MSQRREFIQAYLNDVDLEVFLKTITVIRESSVENEAKTLADKEAWDAAELAEMKAMTLADLEYKNTDHGVLFHIRNKKSGAMVAFSNRAATKNEVRAQILRQALDKLAVHSPQLSLYQALSQIVQNPHFSGFLPYFLSPLGQDLNEDEDERAKNKEKIKAAFAALLSLCIDLFNAADKNKQLEKLQQEWRSDWKEQIIPILSLMEPSEIQYAYARLVFSKFVAAMGQDDPRKTAGEKLLAQVAHIKTQFPEDTALLGQVLWQTQGLLAQPQNQRHQENYLALSQEVSKRRWGKVIGGAMLAVIFASSLTFCCLTGFGAVLAIPALVWSLSYLIPTLTLSVLGSAAGLGLFARGVQQNRKLAEVSKTMDIIPKPF